MSLRDAQFCKFIINFSPMPKYLTAASILIIIYLLPSCGSKAFPDERFNFSPRYRGLISPYRIGDTLSFTNETLGTRSIRITRIDSIITNSKGGFMSQRPYKIIKVYGRPLDYRPFDVNDSSFASINIYPDSLEQSGYFSIMNFRGWIENGNDSVIAELQLPGDRSYSNCFVSRNVAEDLVKGKDDIEYMYVQDTAGVVALKSYRGEWWVRER